jgi:hypothetical protein
VHFKWMFLRSWFFGDVTQRRLVVCYRPFRETSQKSENLIDTAAQVWNLLWRLAPFLVYDLAVGGVSRRVFGSEDFCPTPSLQTGGPGYSCLSGTSLKCCPVWVTLSAASLPPPYLINFSGFSNAGKAVSFHGLAWHN